MKKTFLILIFCVIASFASKAQFSGFVDLLIPAKENTVPFLGPGVMYLHELENGISIGGLAAYRQRLNFNSFSGNIPIMLVSRYYTSGRGRGFYPQAGLGFNTTFNVFKNKFLNRTESYSITCFSYVVGIGGKFKSNLDISGHFEGYILNGHHSGAVLLRVGFGI
ncbi:MAG TPA: hypothetical protein PLW77_00650 [Bacteroidales bacterium]|nr:hypothetical protein [Bacteroidales bacterium]HQB20892.1 hypothetical protein [Bacteroidales bacterium]